VIGQFRCCWINGGIGAWLKSKAPSMSLAFASLLVIGGTLKIVSMKCRTDANS
jgi:hypothetical protein